ncbi:tetratricopeptide repeat protein [Methylotuvimicrobium sp. KM2]|uniref:tetratricopeptide repeat protein n=1 Tax=Methylotuvimicrobium sp. KM2 TaxID=3133976 RepID=UPI0031017591
MIEQNNVSFTALKQKAHEGDAQAQFDLAYCYVRIDGNQDLSLKWLKKSALGGLANAQFTLGLYYYHRLEKQIQTEFGSQMKIDSDIMDILRERRKPLDLTVDPMDFALKLWLNESETNEDCGIAKLAFECFRKAAEQGFVLAKYCLALCYCKGKCIEKNVELAFKWFKEAAEQGLVYAEYSLARCYYDGVGVGQNFELAKEWTLKAVNKEYTKSYLLLGHLYSHGIGIEQNDKVAFDCYKKASECNSEAGFLTACCYLDGKGVEQNYELALEWFNDAAMRGHSDANNWLNNNSKLTDQTNFDVVKSLSPESAGAERFLPLRLSVFIDNKEYDLAKEFVEKIFEIVPYLDQNFKHVCIKAIDQAEELDIKNKQLEVTNKQLQDAQKELEDMMSMFAHKFRSPLDAIIYNTTHENQPKLYAQAAQTMRGLLDVFSIISTDETVLKNRLMQDMQGDSGLLPVFDKTLNMIMMHLLSVSGAEKIQQHYTSYAKSHGLCGSDISRKIWNEEHYELERQLQTDWEQSYADLLNRSATLEQRLSWIEERFFKLELHGFERTDIQFKAYGITESFLTILLNEILVNAFKYYSSADRQPVRLEWTERGIHHWLICRNPSIRNERSRLKGSGKGHVFLSALARKTGSQFSKPKPLDDFVLEFGIPNELLKTD